MEFHIRQYGGSHQAVLEVHIRQYGVSY